MKQQLQTFFRSILIIATALMVAGVVLHLTFSARVFPTSGSTESPAIVADSSERPEGSAVCQPLPITLGEKVAVLRIDDVQGYAWRETTELMIDDALARGIPLTLGIIPKQFSDDRLLTAFLQERACNLEFALHGWDHQVQGDGVTPEFVGLSEAAARTRLGWGIAELQTAGIDSVHTWIPPQNVHSSGTVAAAKSLGFTRLSTEGNGRFDYDATTYAYDTEELLATTQVVTDCESQIAEDGTCIIMMHPQMYANGLEHDQQLYEEYYLTLLDRLTAAGYTFARFTDLDTRE